MALPRWMDVTLKLEWAGLVLLLVVMYHLAGGSWLLFAILILAPDLAMLGYLAGPRIGAIAYNSVHIAVGPVLLFLVWFWNGNLLIMEIATIWAIHIAFDRALGYGLKLSSFQDTHIGRIGRDRADL